MGAISPFLVVPRTPVVMSRPVKGDRGRSGAAVDLYGASRMVVNFLGKSKSGIPAASTLYLADAYTDRIVIIRFCSSQGKFQASDAHICVQFTGNTSVSCHASHAAVNIRC